MSENSALSAIDRPYLDFGSALPAIPLRPKTLPPIPRAEYSDETALLVLDCVCESYGVTRDDIKYGGKRATLAEARNVAYWLLRTVAKLSWPQVGMAMNRDHTSAMSGNKTALRRRGRDPRFAAFTDELAVAVGARIGAAAP